MKFNTLISYKSMPKYTKSQMLQDVNMIMDYIDGFGIDEIQEKYKVDNEHLDYMHNTLFKMIEEIN